MPAGQARAADPQFRPRHRVLQQSHGMCDLVSPSAAASSCFGQHTVYCTIMALEQHGQTASTQMAPTSAIAHTDANVQKMLFCKLAADEANLQTYRGTDAETRSLWSTGYCNSNRVSVAVPTICDIMFCRSLTLKWMA